MFERFERRLAVVSEPWRKATETHSYCAVNTIEADHIFTMGKIPEILNLQPKGAKAKAYQVRQVRDVILKHRLVGGGDEQ